MKKAGVKKIGIRQKLILTFLVVSILPLLIIGGLSISQSAKTIQDEVSFYSDKVTTLLGKNIDLITREIEKEFVSIISDPQVAGALRQQAKGATDYESSTIIKEELMRITGSNEYIPAAMILSPNGNVVSGTFLELPNFEWSKLEKDGIIDAVKKSGGTYWIRGYKTETELLVFKAIIDPSLGGDVGIAVFKVTSLNFQKQIDTLQLDDEDAQIYLLDENGNLILSKEAALIGKSIKEISPNLFDDPENFKFEKPNTPHFGKVQFATYTFCNQGKWKVVMSNPTAVLMKNVNNLSLLIVAMSLLIGAIVVCVGYYIATGVAKPIYAIVSQMAEAEKGNLCVGDLIRGDREVMALAESFRNMIANIRNLIGESTSVVDLVRRNAQDVESMSEGAKRTSAEVSSAIAEIATGANEQAKEVETSMAQMQNLAGTINNVVQKIDEVTSVTEKTTSISHNTAQTIKELNEQTRASSELTKTIKHDIELLNDNAAEIIQVIHLIEEISEQTNLLSLNAAIEAARAGAAGRGFGVVADEVRKLAIQSKDATTKIKQIVMTIQNQAKQTVNSTHKATEVFEGQQKVVERTNSAFGEIIQSMEAIRSQMVGIHGSIGEMDQSKDETVEAMEHIQTIVQQVVALTEELLSCSAEQIAASEQMTDCSTVLRNNVSDLQETINTFKI